MKRSVPDNQVSLNDALRQSKMELSDALQEMPIKDLKKGSESTTGSCSSMNSSGAMRSCTSGSIKTINGFSIYPEAEFWIKRELKLKLGWKRPIAGSAAI